MVISIVFAASGDRGLRALAVFHRVVEQIGERAFERAGLAFMDRRRRRLHGHRHSGVGHVVDDAGEQRGDVDLAARLGVHLVAGESQRRADHVVHLADGREHLVALLGVGDLLRAQPQQRQRRAQIVRQRRQHLGAALDQPAQPLLHAVEGARGALHFGGAGLGQGRRRHVAAEAVGGAGQQAERRGDAPHRPDRDDEHDHPHQRHRDDELPRYRRPALRQGGGERQPLAVAQLDRHLQGAPHAEVRAHHAAACIIIMPPGPPIGPGDWRGSNGAPKGGVPGLPLGSITATRT